MPTLGYTATPNIGEVKYNGEAGGATNGGSTPQFFSPDYDCEVDSLVFYGKYDTANSATNKCYIWNLSDAELVVDSTLSFSVTNQNEQWLTQNYGTKPLLYSNKNYGFYVACCNNDEIVLYYKAGNWGDGRLIGSNACSSPALGVSTARQYGIYINYTGLGPADIEEIRGLSSPGSIEEMRGLIWPDIDSIIR